MNRLGPHASISIAHTQIHRKGNFISEIFGSEFVGCGDVSSASLGVFGIEHQIAKATCDCGSSVAVVPCEGPDSSGVGE